MADQGSDDVASTLNDLERKLRALESDLQSVVDEPTVPAAPVEQPRADPPVEQPRADPPVEQPRPDPPVEQPSIYEPLPPLPPLPPIEPRPERVAEQPPPPLTSEDPEQIVAEARRRISDLRAELDELARAREDIAKTANELVSGYNRAFSDSAASVPAPPPAPPVAPPPVAQPLLPEHTIQHGPVAIDAGFFRDLTSLTAFEQAIARVPGVVGVHVRGFAEGRALIDAQLSHPIPLGAELARHAPLRFTVTDAGPQHLMLAIAG